ncbi:hypothetical protein JCM10450v2_005386 [Rhodotorula kratochvilovae]
MPPAEEIVTKTHKVVGQGREGLVRLATAMYAAVLGRSRPHSGVDLAYERLALWVASMERYFSRAYYQQHLRSYGARVNESAVRLFNHVGALLLGAESAKNRAEGNETQRAEVLQLPAFLQPYVSIPALPAVDLPTPSAVPFNALAVTRRIEEEQGTGRRGLGFVVGLMPIALLGRGQALRGAHDHSHDAVVQWGEAIMRDFSPQYYLQYLNPDQVDCEAGHRRVFEYFKGLVEFWNEQRLRGPQSENERTTLVSPDAIRQTLSLPAFLWQSPFSPEAGPAANEPSDHTPSAAASPSTYHRDDAASLFPDAHLGPSSAFSLGVEPRLGLRSARAYGTTAKRWAAGRAMELRGVERRRPTSTTASIDPNFGAVHRWGEDVLERFSPEYCKTYLNPKRKAQKPDVDRLWRYFKQLAIDSDERRQDRATTEAERVQVLVRFL